MWWEMAPLCWEGRGEVTQEFFFTIVLCPTSLLRRVERLGYCRPRVLPLSHLLTSSLMFVCACVCMTEHRILSHLITSFHVFSRVYTSVCVCARASPCPIKYFPPLTHLTSSFLFGHVRLLYNTYHQVSTDIFRGRVPWTGIRHF